MEINSTQFGTIVLISNKETSWKHLEQWGFLNVKKAFLLNVDSCTIVKFFLMILLLLKYFLLVSIVLGLLKFHNAAVVLKLTETSDYIMFLLWVIFSNNKNVIPNYVLHFKVLIWARCACGLIQFHPSL